MTATAAPATAGRAAGTLVLGLTGMIAWAQALGPGVCAATPALLVAVFAIARRLPRSTSVLLASAWLALTPVIASLPAAAFKPSAWPATSTHLVDASRELLAPGGGGSDQGWPLALILAVLGTVWLLGGALSTRRPGTSALGMVVVALPAVAAGLLYRDVAWQGAALVAGAMLWLSPRPAVLAGAGAVGLAVLAAGVTNAIRPDGPWQLPGLPTANAAFTSLNPEQTYGTLGRRTGRAMFEITTDRPALWRAQVLDRFNGRGWAPGGGSQELAEPAAVPVTSTVRIRGLRDELMVAPGEIQGATARGIKVRRNVGDSRTMSPKPGAGDSYTVRSTVVRATRAELAAVPFSRDSPATAYTVDRDRYPIPIERFGNNWARTFRLAHNLTATALTPLEAVERVQSYLRDSGRFTYTTDVGPVGENPITDFLLSTHRGYCQHFAGAAAMLLRMGGVPARVIVGFATGRPSGRSAGGQRRYTVRDDDAHAWIEVYFDGIGWVTFNPTPPAAAAQIDRAAAALPPQAAPAGPVGTATTLAGGGLVVVGAALLGNVLWRRRRRWPRATVGGQGRLTAGLERIAGPLPAGHTLAQLRADLEQRVGPHTAALAATAERARYAPGSPPVPAQPRRALWRALRADVGTRRATRLLSRPSRRGA